MLSLGVTGVLEHIFVAPYSGEPMQELSEAEAMAGSGLRGDRYTLGTGHWSGVDDCQVTLVEAEIIERIEQDAGIMIQAGEHRRNLVTRGVRLHQLLGKRFRIGDVWLEYDRPRPPCPHLMNLAGPKVARSFFGQRGGICARILSNGVIRVSDRITTEDDTWIPGERLETAKG